MSDFWSKRRAAVEAENDAELAEVHEAKLEASAAEKTDAELLDELGLPDPDNMGADDDFSAFMNDLVPARLKTRALRKLWRLNPLLANIDGLVDYGEDFTDAAMVVENMQTTYQVGKGMMTHVRELERQALEENADVEEAPAEAENDDELTIEELITADVDEEAPESTAIALASDDAEPEIALSPPTHRMQFQFEDQHTA